MSAPVPYADVYFSNSEAGSIKTDENGVAELYLYGEVGGFLAHKKGYKLDVKNVDLPPLTDVVLKLRKMFSDDIVEFKYRGSYVPYKYRKVIIVGDKPYLIVHACLDKCFVEIFDLEKMEPHEIIYVDEPLDGDIIFTEKYLVVYKITKDEYGNDITLFKVYAKSTGMKIREIQVEHKLTSIDVYKNIIYFTTEEGVTRLYRYDIENNELVKMYEEYHELSVGSAIKIVGDYLFFAYASERHLYLLKYDLTTNSLVWKKDYGTCYSRVFKVFKHYNYITIACEPCDTLYLHFLHINMEYGNIVFDIDARIGGEDLPSKDAIIETINVPYLVIAWKINDEIYYRIHDDISGDLIDKGYIAIPEYSTVVGAYNTYVYILTNLTNYFKYGCNGLYRTVDLINKSIQEMFIGEITLEYTPLIDSTFRKFMISGQTIDGRGIIMLMDFTYSLVKPKQIINLFLFGRPVKVEEDVNKVTVLAIDFSDCSLHVLKIDIENCTYEEVKTYNNPSFMNIFYGTLGIQFSYENEEITLLIFTIDGYWNVLLIDKNGNVVNQINVGYYAQVCPYIVLHNYIVYGLVVGATGENIPIFTFRIIEVSTGKTFTIAENVITTSLGILFIPVYRLGSNIVIIVPYNGETKIIYFNFREMKIVKTISISTTVSITTKSYGHVLDNIFFAIWQVTADGHGYGFTKVTICDILSNECYEIEETEQQMQLTTNSIGYITFNGRYIVYSHRYDSLIAVFRITRVGKVMNIISNGLLTALTEMILMS